MNEDKNTLDYDLIFDEIKKVRRSKHISQNKIAKALNIYPTTYCKIESGNIHVSLEKIDKVCTYLEIDIANLFARASKTSKTYLEKTFSDYLVFLSYRKRKFILRVLKLLIVL